MNHAFARLFRPATLLAVTGLAAFALWRAAAVAPPPPSPVPLAEIQALARLPEGEQRQATNQRRILTWFLADVEQFRAGRNSVAARSLPVEMGPACWPLQDPLTQRIVPSPFGNGPFSLTFSAARSNPATFVNTLTGNRWWEFPIPTNLYCGNPDTCWEEMQHALLGEDVPLLNEPDVARSFAFLKTPTADDRENREHVFIEYAAGMRQWLDELSTFEIEAQKAYAAEMQVWKSGVRIDREAEHYLWRAVATKWDGAWFKNIWDRGANRSKLPPLNAALRRRYRAVAQVWLPEPDEVRNFYLRGGLTDDADPLRNKGSAIKIPEWVMRPPMRSRLVTMPHTPEAPAPVLVPADAARKRPERLECRFSVEALDQYSPIRGDFQAGLRNPVMRGKLTAFVRSPIDLEAEAGLEVTVNGKSYPLAKVQDGRVGVEIPLRGLYRDHRGVTVGSNAEYLTALGRGIQPLKMDLVFFRNQPKGFKNKQYQVAVLYQDEDDTLGPALYEDSQAVFIVNFGDPNAGTPPPAPPTTPPGVPAAPPTGPHWKLTRDWADDRSDTVAKGPAVRQDLALGRVETSDKLVVTQATQSAFEYTRTYTYRTEKVTRTGSTLGGVKVNGGSVRMIAARSHTWTVPPPFLIVGQALPMRLAVTTKGSEAKVEPPDANTAERKALYDRQAFGEGTTQARMLLVAPGPASGPGSGSGIQPRLIGELNAAAGAPPAQRDFLVPARETARPVLDVVIVSSNPGSRAQYAYTFRYEWNESASAPPPVTFTRETQEPRTEHPEIDNVPEEVEEAPPDETPTAAGERWYLHASRDWRIKLSGAWQIEFGATPDADDVLTAPGGAYRIRVRRDYQTFTGTPEAALARHERALQGEHPGSVATRVTLGPVAATQVRLPATKTESPQWAFVLAHLGRVYRLRVLGGASVEQPLAVLKTLQYLRALGETESRPPQYIHPSGAFRLPLPADWVVFERHLNASTANPDYDFLTDPIDTNVLIVWRAVQQPSDPDGGFAKKEAELLKQYPAGKAERFTLAGAPALRVTVPWRGGNVCTYCYVLRGGRRYYFRAVGAPGADEEQTLPAPVPLSILNGLVFLDSSLTGTGVPR